ncbi:MAG TPA: ribosome maturation factor RimP [Thermodesulfobacteriota bacterium]|nr:ribosome maturation factor RimP [Thermodesulfobacteriota bacterium]
MEEKVIDDVREILDPLIQEEGLELVDIEYRREGRGKVLRIYIDKEGGVTIGDCTKISRELGVLLDIHDVVPGPYTLEVSSPGLNRALKKPRDFERFKGRKVRIKTRSSIEGRVFFIGRLLDFTDNMASVDVDGRTYLIPYEEIERANLELDF